MSNLKIFAQRLEQEIKANKITQKKLAESIGVQPATISSYLKNSEGDNKGKNPSLNVAIEIAKYFHVSLDWLCGLSEQKSHNNENAIEYLSDYLPYLVESIDALDDFSVQTESEEFELGLSTTVNIQSHNQILYEFFKNYETLRNAKESGALTDTLYHLALDALYQNFGLYIIVDRKITEDSDLPFPLLKNSEVN